jgi:hypothetical protein
VLNILNQELLDSLDPIRKDKSLFTEKNFTARANAMDDLKFQIIDRLQILKVNADSAEMHDEIIHRTKQTIDQLETVDAKMFERLRTEIAKGKYRGNALIKLIDEHMDHRLETIIRQHTVGYDHLDSFINGLLTHVPLPPESGERESGMVFYQKTPARIVFQIVRKSTFKPDDVFFDLGSGPGQVTMLVNLLSSVVSKGVEYETAFYDYAKQIAAGLNLRTVEFINADARNADYSTGTVFFMYSPFEGTMFKEVMQKLCAESERRTIRLFTFGPCTADVEREGCLSQVSKIANYDTEPGEFITV